MRLFCAMSMLLLSSVSVLAQTSTAIGESSARLSLGRPTFSDIRQYNALDFAGSPVGLFETESVTVSAAVNLRYLRWHDHNHVADALQKSTAWNLPDLLVGKPQVFYARLNYTPAFIADEASFAPRQVSMFLHRFGLSLAGQAPKGVFQIGLHGDGYFTEEDLAGSDNTRLIMGLRDLSATIGTRLHELVGIGMRGGVSAQLDSLRDRVAPANHDRYFEGQIPRLAWFADVGKPGFPVQSDFAIGIAKSRFVYVTDPGGGDQDPIRGDSLFWKWQALGDFAGSGMRYRPALYLGYWRNNYQAYAPTPDNDDLSVGAKRDGRNWTISDFRFGIGGSVLVLRYATAYWEYAHSVMGLTYGATWPGPRDKKTGYDRIALSAEGNLRAITALHLPPSIEAFVRLGYFNQRENSGINAFGADEFGLVNQVDVGTQIDRDAPDFGWGRDQRVIGFTVGLGASFLNKALSANLHWAFLGRSGATQRSGFAFGADVGYALRHGR